MKFIASVLAAVVAASVTSPVFVSAESVVEEKMGKAERAKKQKGKPVQASSPLRTRPARTGVHQHSLEEKQKGYSAADLENRYDTVLPDLDSATSGGGHHQRELQGMYVPYVGIKWEELCSSEGLEMDVMTECIWKGFIPESAAAEVSVEQDTSPVEATIAEDGVLTTLFNRNNGGSDGGAIYFDLTAQRCVTITGWEFNTAGTGSITGSLYSRSGSASGFQTTTAGWAPVAVDVPTTGAGQDNPTSFDFGEVDIEEGSTIGFAVIISSGNDYTNGGTNGALDFYEDSMGILRLDDMGATNVPFTGGVFDPRMVNTNLHFRLSFDCEDNNPCIGHGYTHDHHGQFYFEHCDSKIFIQCSEYGQCFERHCPYGTRWSQAVQTCIRESCVPEGCDDPCTPDAIASEDLFHPFCPGTDHEDPYKFIQCSKFGESFCMHCGPYTMWDEAVGSCDHLRECADPALNNCGPNDICIELPYPKTFFCQPCPTVSDGFETGDFGALSWSGDWEIESDIGSGHVFEGSFSARNMDIDNNEQSTLMLQFEISCDSTISFWFKTSTESSFDFLQFFLDGDMIDEWSGTNDWTLFELHDVAAGTHTVTFTYDKDGSVSSGDDTVWIDNFRVGL
uniref:Chitin-binding type-2 domain-containing protein n=1 Tax=Pseudictyota dubia TaxID=2749911 RepID=A0A7R9Z462_9STRA|mmetsp:Transcript_2365/g.4120  ORF Transcript_2365/g.4120 Transcript_2365/m.4120 type:complete len:621 (+) Transcript_2365:191-2053(+)